MLTGRINDELQAWVSMGILDGAGELHPVEVLLDTGFNGELALTSSVIRRFNLVRGMPRFAELATGDTTLLPSFTATILWDDQPRFVSVIEADSEPLLGMELLLGNRVTLDVRDGGPVTIDALP